MNILSRLGTLFALFALSVIAIILGTLSWVSESKSPIPAGMNAQETVAFFTNLKGERLAEVRDFAKLQLQKKPLNRNALQLLGSVDGGLADKNKQADVQLQLSRYSLRDPVSQTNAINILFSRGEYAEGLRHLDGLLRARGELQKELFPLLAAQASNRQFFEEFARLMATQPSWRNKFFYYLFEKQPTALAMRELRFKLVGMGQTVSDEEMRLILAKMFSLKSYDEAYFTWLDGLSPQQLSRVGPLYDGSFSQEPKNFYFDWHVGQGQNFTAGLQPRQSKSNDLVLAISFSGNRAAFGDVYQFLKLAPGRYDLKGEAEIRSFKTTGGLAWRLSCVGTSQPIGATKAFLSDQNWTAFTTPFEVPAQSCETQLLRLESASTASLDQQISGRISFDNLQIAVRP
jgi:hypothetical protein